MWRLQRLKKGRGHSRRKVYIAKVWKVGFVCIGSRLRNDESGLSVGMVGKRGGQRVALLVRWTIDLAFIHVDHQVSRFSCHASFALVQPEIRIRCKAIVEKASLYRINTTGSYHIVYIFETLDQSFLLSEHLPLSCVSSNNTRERTRLMQLLHFKRALWFYFLTSIFNSYHFCTIFQLIHCSELIVNKFN